MFTSNKETIKELAASKKLIKAQDKKIRKLEKIEEKFLQLLEQQDCETERDVEKLSAVKKQLESRILELQSEMLGLEGRAHRMRSLTPQFYAATTNFIKTARLVSDTGTTLKQLGIGTELNEQLIQCAKEAECVAENFRLLAHTES